MKKFVIFYFVLSSSFLFAQTVLVKQENQKIKGESLYGFATTIEAPASEVSNALVRYLKTYGKPKVQDNQITVSETTFSGQAYTKALIASSELKGNSTKAWMGINLKEWAADSSVVLSQLEDMVKQFGVNFYRDKIQAQIDEAQKAVDIVDKQQQRTLNEQQNIQQRIESNKREHQQLVKAIQKNRADSAALVIRLQVNKASNDSLKVVSEKVKQALIFQRERQSKVN